jgi:hypothetical protein
MFQTCHVWTSTIAAARRARAAQASEAVGFMATRAAARKQKPDAWTNVPRYVKGSFVALLRVMKAFPSR